MRKTFRFLSGCAIAALMLGGLASCEDKDIDAPDSPGVADRDITQYMAVTISAPKDSPFSRADASLPGNDNTNFQDGGYDESAINSLDFFFFNDKDEPAATHYRITEFEDDAFKKDGTNYYITKFASVVVEVNSTQAANLPTQTICFVNMSKDDAEALENKNISTIRNTTIKSIKNGDYFIMSSSVYFGTSPITGEAKQRICAAKISGKLFNIEKDALDELKKPTSDKVVEVYVERLAAKVGLNLNRTNADGTATITPYTLVWGDKPTYTHEVDGEQVTESNTVNLTFTPTHWFMNATSREEYVTKRYGVNDNGNVNLTPTFEQINTLMNKGGMKGAWNQPDFFRSYWGCSPSYYQDNYPKTAADIPGKTYPVYYWSYNDITGITTGMETKPSVITATNEDGKPYFSYTAGTTYPETSQAKATGWIYSLETTTASSNINNGTNPAATIASAVLIGQYSYQQKVDGIETEATTPTNSAFFIDEYRGYVEVGEGDNKTKELHGTFYSSESAANQNFITLQETVYVKKQGATDDDTNPKNFELVTTYSDDCPISLAHPSNTVPGATNLAARLYALQFTVPKTGNSNYYYFNDASGKFELITETNVGTVNSALLAVPGYLNKYDKGHAMFSIPIRHLGFGFGITSTDPNNQLVSSDGNYLWKNIRVGDFGLVRNHVYQLNITSIGGLGTGIIDSQPIVPPVETIKQFIAVKLNVLSWRVVPPQNVDL